ncbi:MAG: recombinase family protein [Deltaproteobacteria bacterium]|nr:recombinase family protein [Deltaproteobacteria bacterium]
MRAAIYARRSKDHQKDSIAVQLAASRQYIADHGWSLDEQHI